MAFDRTDPADLAALQTEVNTDPIGMGYDPTGPTNPLLKLLNDPVNNVGEETVAQDLSPEVLLDVVDTPEFAGNQVDQGERDFFRMVFDFGNAGRLIEKYRAKIKGLFPPNGPTNTAIDALVRALSRAEVLFDAGTTISRDDWFAARDS